MPKQETLDILSKYTAQPTASTVTPTNQPKPETLDILGKYTNATPSPNITSKAPESEGFIPQAIESTKRAISTGLGDIAGVFSMIGGAMKAPKGKTAFDSLADRFKDKPIDQGQADFATKAFEIRDRVKAGTMQELGGSSGAPRATSVAGRAAEGLADAVNPINLAMPYRKLFGLGEMSIRSLLGAGAGAGAVLGKEAGAPVGSALGGLAQTPLGEPILGLGKYFGVGSPYGVVGKVDFAEGGRKTGEAVGSLIGGAAGAISASRIPHAVTAGKLARDLREGTGEISQQFGDKINVTAKGIAQERVLDLFNKAYNSSPTFSKDIDELLSAESKTGISIPVGNLMNSPIINDAIRNVAKTDPTFKQKYLRQFEDAKLALADQSMLFGEPSGAAGAIRSGGLKDRDITGLSKDAAARMERKDAALTRQYGRISKQELGIKADMSVSQAEEAARAQATPFYNDSFRYAEDKKLIMPDSTVKVIYDDVVGAQASDIFKRFPEIYKMVKTEFAPSAPKAIATQNALMGKNDYPSGQFKARSVEVLDSLKRSVNRSLRKARDETELLALQDLKKTIQGEIEAIDPEFSRRYRLADKVYAEKFGIPFDAESLRQISRARFVENIVPVLTKNKSAIEQIKTVLGSDGEKLIKDAFKHDLYDSVVVNSTNPATWLSRNRDALSAIPKGFDEFKRLANDHDSLMSYKAFAEGEWLDKAKASLIRVEGREAKDIVADIYKSDTYVDGLLKQYGHKKDAINAIKSIMLDDILSSGDISSALNDRFKSSTYRKIFGDETFDNRIKPIAMLTDALTKNDPTELHTSFSEIMNPSVVSSITGTPLKTVMSLLVTNPVVSAEVAITQLLGNFFRNKVGKATHDELARILLDKTEALKLKNMLDERAKKGLIDKNGNLISLSKDATEFAKMLGGKMVEITARDAQSGAVRGQVNQNDDAKNENQNNDVELFYGE